MSLAPLKRAKPMSPPRTNISNWIATATACVNTRAGFISTPGTHDGLYWPPEDQADISPLDGFAEDANLAARSGEKPEPYDGYYFRILTAQGPAAPGGAFSYLINGHMIAGHAMIAWPADLRRQRRRDLYLRRERRRLPKGPRAEHRRSRRFDGPVQSRRDLEGRRVAATTRVADRLGSRNSKASFSQVATSREPRPADNRIQLKLVRPATGAHPRKRKAR